MRNTMRGYYVGETVPDTSFKVLRQGLQSLLAYSEAKDEYVAWSADDLNNNGKLNCYWGRYGTFDYAKQCFDMKESGKYSGN